MKPEEEDKIVEALDQLRLSYNLRQYRVCSLICESLAEKFRAVTENMKETPIQVVKMFIGA
jgi:hypothetical protein